MAFNKKEYARQWREANRDKTREYGRRYARKNRDKIAQARKLASEEQKALVREQQKSWARANPDKVKAAKARYRAKMTPEQRQHERDVNRMNRKALAYGLTKEQVVKEEAKTHCPICLAPFSQERRGPASQCFDHCHTSGHFRGVICFRCNTALGMFQDNSESMLRAVKYLDSWYDAEEAL
jgi:hypothetical protein